MVFISPIRGSKWHMIQSFWRSVLFMLLLQWRQWVNPHEVGRSMLISYKRGGFLGKKFMLHLKKAPIVLSHRRIRLCRRWIFYSISWVWRLGKWKRWAKRAEKALENASCRKTEKEKGNRERERERERERDSDREILRDQMGENGVRVLFG